MGYAVPKGSSKHFKAVLFDKDGVLIDSIDTCFYAFNAMLRHCGRPEVTRDYYVSELWGKRSGSVFDGIKDITAAEVRDCVEYYNMVRDSNRDKTRVYPNTIEVLASIKASGMLRIGLVTNTERSRALGLLEIFSLGSYFDVVVGGNDANPKPSPELILLACIKLKIKPSEALYVGDTIIDIAAGKSAGCTTAIVATSKTFEELSEVEGIIPLRNLSEVLKLIGDTS